MGDDTQLSRAGDRARDHEKEIHISSPSVFFISLPYISCSIINILHRSDKTNMTGNTGVSSCTAPLSSQSSQDSSQHKLESAVEHVLQGEIDPTPSGYPMRRWYHHSCLSSPRLVDGNASDSTAVQETITDQTCMYENNGAGIDLPWYSMTASHRACMRCSSRSSKHLHSRRDAKANRATCTVGHADTKDVLLYASLSFLCIKPSPGPRFPPCAYTSHLFGFTCWFVRTLRRREVRPPCG
nr:hypothetical protein CFP56_16853 [Quercus suber]